MGKGEKEIMYTSDNVRIQFDPGDEGEYQTPATSNVDQTSKPQTSTNVQPTKDFKKIMGKTRREGKEGKNQNKSAAVDEEEIVPPVSKEEEENVADGAAFSLFDLSKSQAHPDKEQEKQPSIAPVEARQSTSAPPLKAATESPSDLFKRMSSAEPPKAIAKSEHADAQEHAHKTFMKEEFTTRYIPEHADTSFVNPPGAIMQPPPQIAPTEEVQIERPAALSPAMQDLINQIVRQMYTVETEGKTDTVIVLQYPPMFKDVNVVVTSFDSARGQFNITFENLTQAAQKLLDQQDSRKNLINALAEKGYGVQILTMTTQVENRPVDDTTFERGRGGQQNQEDKDDERERKR
jgi:hypothetical protein